MNTTPIIYTVSFGSDGIFITHKYGTIYKIIGYVKEASELNTIQFGYISFTGEGATYVMDVSKALIWESTDEDIEQAALNSL